MKIFLKSELSESYYEIFQDLNRDLIVDRGIIRNDKLLRLLEVIDVNEIIVEFTKDFAINMFLDYCGIIADKRGIKFSFVCDYEPKNENI